MTDYINTQDIEVSLREKEQTPTNTRTVREFVGTHKATTGPDAPRVDTVYTVNDYDDGRDGYTLLVDYHFYANDTHETHQQTDEYQLDADMNPTDHPGDLETFIQSHHTADDQELLHIARNS